MRAADGMDDADNKSRVDADVKSLASNRIAATARSSTSNPSSIASHPPPCPPNPAAGNCCSPRSTDMNEESVGSNASLAELLEVKLWSTTLTSNRAKGAPARRASGYL
jgi:hypothetical protein